VTRQRIALLGIGSLLGLGFLAALTVAAVFLSTAFVVTYARTPAAEAGH
jgi:hypothetical protein